MSYISIEQESVYTAVWHSERQLVINTTLYSVSLNIEQFSMLPSIQPEFMNPFN